MGLSTGAGALGATGLSGLLGLLSSGGNRSQFATPDILKGPQQGQIDLLQSLLAPAGGNAFDPLKRYFGDLGVPQTDLQRQSSGGISQFLNQPGPERQTLDTVRPILEGMLTGTGPQFERDLALGNQQGARFGSANAILRGEAFRNLFNLRNQTAGTLGMLSSQAGNADFGRLLGGFGVGQQEAQQQDIGLARLLSLFGGLFGGRQQLVAGLPITQRPSTGQQLGQFGKGLAQLLPFLIRGTRETPGRTDVNPYGLPF